MTQPPDELRSLWACGPTSEPRDAAALLRHLESATRSFDRTIRFRDLREIVAGLAVAAIFLWLSFHDRSALERAAHLYLAACGVWVAVYMRRYARLSRRPAPDQSLLAYREDLLARYDRQIRLLRNVKYTCLLPFWTGLMLSNVAHWARTGSHITLALMTVWVTLINAGLWWLNEVYAVGWLERQRRAFTGM